MLMMRVLYLVWHVFPPIVWAAIIQSTDVVVPTGEDVCLAYESVDDPRAAAKVDGYTGTL